MVLYSGQDIWKVWTRETAKLEQKIEAYAYFYSSFAYMPRESSGYGNEASFLHLSSLPEVGVRLSRREKGRLVFMLNKLLEFGPFDKGLPPFESFPSEPKLPSDVALEGYWRMTEVEAFLD